jgi:hypothetical protein
MRFWLAILVLLLTVGVAGASYLQAPFYQNGTYYNLTIVEESFFTTFTDIFGRSEIVFLFVFAFFAYLCIQGRLSAEESSMVFLPLVFGVVTDEWLPLWIKAIFIISIMIVWAMAILRITREG